MGSTAVVTERQARKVRELVIERFPGYTRDENGVLLPEDRLPVLRKPNTGWGHLWSLAWEGESPYGWTTMVTLGAWDDRKGVFVPPITWPRGVLCEPDTGVELDIFREEQD